MLHATRNNRKGTLRIDNVPSMEKTVTDGLVSTYDLQYVTRMPAIYFTSKQSFPTKKCKYTTSRLLRFLECYKCAYVALRGKVTSTSLVML